MVKLSGCDCVKMEVAAGHAELVKTLADAGVAVMAHLGLRPQSVGIMGGYKFQASTAADADNLRGLGAADAEKRGSRPVAGSGAA